MNDLRNTSRSPKEHVAAGGPARSLMRANLRVTGAMEDALARTGLTLPRFSVLVELAATPDGRLPLLEVGRRCMKSPPNVTAIVDRLEAAGLVRRMRDDADRRVVQAEITGRGRRILGYAAPRVLTAEIRAFAPLTPSERGRLTALLERVAPAE